MLLLALLVSIEKAHISLTAAPEHIVCTAELDSSVDGVLDLYCCTCNYIKIRICRSSVHIALVTEYVCCSPKKLDACLGLLLLEVCNNFLETSLILLNVRALVYQVYIMEAIVLDAHLLHELESCIDLILGRLYRARSTVPREGLCSATELIRALCAECVPPCHRELEPLGHSLAEDHLLCIIIAESHRVSALLAFKLNLVDSWEKFFCCHCFMFCCL